MAEEIIVTVDDTQETVSLFVDVGGAAGVDSFNSRTGVVSPTTGDYNTSQVTEVTNLYYTEARVSANSAVALNTAKVGITPTQASDITTNNSKTGITAGQASDITTNNSKISYTDATAVGLNTAKVGITTQQATDITTNNSKISYTDAAAVALNTAKIGVFDDRESVEGSLGATLALDFDSYETWTGTLTEALTLSITNAKVKVVTLDLTGDFAITYPATSSVVGDTYDGTGDNKITIEWKASSIFITVTNY